MRQAVFYAIAIFLATLLVSAAFGQVENAPQPAGGQTPFLPNEDKNDNLVTLDFEDADIRDVIKVITLASGLNMVIGEDVQAKVTISLKDMPWERALDVILRTYNFTYKRENSLIRIMTFEKVKEEERDIPLVTRIVYLNFAKVSAMQGTLSKALSERGRIETDARTNSMVVTDIPGKVEEIERVARQLDTRTPQVMIEAMLIDVKLSKDDELGINWKMVQALRPLNQDGRADTTYIEQPSSMSAITDTAIKIGWVQRLGEYGINGLIQAWVQSNKAKVLASPKVLTLDNEEAIIEIILEIPYISNMSEQGNVSYSFKEVGTKLHVRPQISSGGFVSMNLKPELSYQSDTAGGQPVISTRKAELNVLVRDGETIVIGGLRRIDDTKTYTKIPILGDIPILGQLFRKKDLRGVDTELLMFVTPHVVVKPHIKPEEYEKYKWMDEMTSPKKAKGMRQKQAVFIEPEAKDTPVSWPQDTEIIEPLPQDAPEKSGQKELESDRDYIYAW